MPLRAVKAIARIGERITKRKKAPEDANDIIDLLMTRASEFPLYWVDLLVLN